MRLPRKPVPPNTVMVRPVVAALASVRGSTGRVRPGNPPHSGDLSVGGAVLPVDSGQARPPSDKDARWHDRAPAARRRDRRRTAANRSPAVPQQPDPIPPSELDFPLRPAAPAESVEAERGKRTDQGKAGGERKE